MKLPLKIYTSKYYWLLKSKVEKAKSTLNWQKFKLNKFIYRNLLAILKAFGFVSILFFVEYVASHYWQLCLPALPNWIIKFQEILPKPSYPQDRDAIIELISIIASVTGVILALFYPLLATIASTAYAKVHSSIRNLLLSEENTQAYLRKLTFLTASSIIVLLFLSFGMKPGNLILSLIVIYSLTTLFGILKIGMGIYNFFEPSTLANISAKKLKKSINDVTVDSKYYFKEEIQIRSFSEMNQQIENLSLLLNLCIKDIELNESSFKSTFKILVDILNHYIRYKSKIPVNSIWFRQSLRNWSFFESDREIRRYFQQKNFIPFPAKEKDQFWFEDRIIYIISIGLNSTLEKGRVEILYDILYDPLSTIQNLSQSLGSIAEIGTSEKLFSKLYENLKLITQKGNQDKILNYEKQKYEIAIVDGFCCSILNFLFGIFEYITKFDSNKLRSEYNKLDWKNRNCIYSSDFIPELYESINEIYGNIESELYIEGERITPDWHFKQMLISDYLWIISEKIPASVKLIDIYLLSLANHFNENKNPILSTFIAQISLEIIAKIETKLDDIKPTLNDLKQLKVNEHYIRYTFPNFDDIENLLLSYKSRCNKIIINNVETLSNLKWDNQFPDIFGFAYSNTLTHINNCFEENNFDAFSYFFASFMKSSLNSFENLSLESPQYISYQPILHLLEISGYAYIYSKIYNEPKYWIIVKEVWDKEFAPTDKFIEEEINKIVECYTYYLNNIPERKRIYNEKKDRNDTLVYVVEHLKIDANNIDDFFLTPIIKHPKSYNIAELFVEIYLFTFVEAKNATKLLSNRDRSLFGRWCLHIEDLKYNNNYV